MLSRVGWLGLHQCITTSQRTNCVASRNCRSVGVSVSEQCRGGFYGAFTAYRPLSVKLTGFASVLEQLMRKSLYKIASWNRCNQLAMKNTSHLSCTY